MKGRRMLVSMSVGQSLLIEDGHIVVTVVNTSAGPRQSAVDGCRPSPDENIVPGHRS